MSISNFIPTVWSETLISALDKKYIAVANCNREFEGEIKNQGSSVKICGVGSVDIRNYYRDSDMNYCQSLDDTAVELLIDQAKYFNFQIDDIDRTQGIPKLMEAAMKVAASGLANAADQYIYSMYEQAGTSIKRDIVTAENIIDCIIDARQALYENNVSDDTEVVIEVSPAIAAIILKAKVSLSTDNTEALEAGCIGSIGGCKIFVSNNIVKTTVNSTKFHKCLVRTKRAIAFAEQLSEIEAFRPEKRFADAVKGLHLYGASVIYPTEMVLLDLGVAV